MAVRGSAFLDIADNDGLRYCKSSPIVLMSPLEFGGGLECSLFAGTSFAA
jgi:hypothetical protein